MIIVRTNCDLATSYTYAWTSVIITAAEQRGINVTVVEGAAVNMQNFARRVEKVKPELIMFNGHGTKSSFFDNDWKELVNLESSRILKNTITFARACDCLVELGVKAVAEGCIAFIGYHKKFMIPRWHSKTCLPLEDVAAKPVMECSNRVVLELLKNKTVGETVNNAHRWTEQQLIHLIYSREPYSAAALQAVVHNDSSLNFVGDALAKMSW